MRIPEQLQRQVARRAAAEGITPHEWLMLALEQPDLLRIGDARERRTTVRYVAALRRHGIKPTIDRRRGGAV